MTRFSDLVLFQFKLMILCLLHQGNYDMFVKTRAELLENQMKQYHWEQDQIAHMKVSRNH